MKNNNIDYDQERMLHVFNRHNGRLQALLEETMEDLETILKTNFHPNWAWVGSFNNLCEASTILRDKVKELKNMTKFEPLGRAE